MKFQTLLPAILFAQSSFAYECCFEIVGAHGFFSSAESLKSGGLQVWRPFGDTTPPCEIMIAKTGASCKEWKYSMAQKTCSEAKPLIHVGVTTKQKCLTGLPRRA
ncbi:hypothetical protein EG327_008504 [Venturia inaequalis]|uniref:Uncharacterized protein n=1 Tax=Venturia inaequalis TaxID=5025 RepID=A0A8H3URA9_VENIN|nr:hypothetical protein EG327_008504 [Venturia inaequalis]